MGRSSPLIACHYLTYYYLLSIILSQRPSYFLSRSVSALSILTLKTPPKIISQITNCILNSRFVFLASYLASYANDDCVDDDGDGDLVLHATDEVQFLLSGTNKISVPFAFN